MNFNPFKKKSSPPTSPKAAVRSLPYKKTQLSASTIAEWSSSPATKTLSFSRDVIHDKTKFRGAFFDLIARYYPMASNAVWVWKHLCSTNPHTRLIGGSDDERKRSREILDDLNTRISPLPFVRNGGVGSLISVLFEKLFTYGRFAGNLHLYRDGSGIEKFSLLNPFDVKFTQPDLSPYYATNNRDFLSVNPNTFYYYGLRITDENPYGSSMFEAAGKLLQIADQMIIDMSKVASNAGTPRLHIKVSQPEIQENEDPKDYIERAQAYFDSTVDEFTGLAPDDNIYTWSDVNVSNVGGHPGASGFVWNINRGVIDEEIISAFHLFPWVLGKSAATTKNWVSSQFDLLMEQVESIQLETEKLLNWIQNTELRLKGITNTSASNTFQRMRDPAQREMAIAERFRISNVKSKVLMGFITPNDGARELGYDRAVDEKRIFNMKDNQNKPINSDDNSLAIDSTEERLERIEDMLSELSQNKGKGIK